MNIDVPASSGRLFLSALILFLMSLSLFGMAYSEAAKQRTSIKEANETLQDCDVLNDSNAIICDLARHTITAPNHSRRAPVKKGQVTLLGNAAIMAGLSCSLYLLTLALRRRGRFRITEHRVETIKDGFPFGLVVESIPVETITKVERKKSTLIFYGKDKNLSVPIGALDFRGMIEDQIKSKLGLNLS